MSEVWVSIIVAVISAGGTIVGALISSKQQLPTFSRVGLMAGGFLLGLGLGVLVVTFVSAQVDPCPIAKITFPPGDRSRNGDNAALFPASSPTQISWDQPQCVMTVEYYQSERLGKKYKDVQTGQTISIGAPDSGKTQIKFWKEGRSSPSDSVWVWVK